MGRLLFIVVLLLITQQLSAQQPIDSLKQKADTSAALLTRADSIVDFARQHLTLPYRYGYTGPDAFDCSGFVYYVFKHFRLELPRTSSDFTNLGKTIPISECKKGDIILFTGTKPGDQQVGHIGIVISKVGEPLLFIHSSSSEKHPGVVITDYANSHYPDRFVKIIRVLE